MKLPDCAVTRIRHLGKGGIRDFADLARSVQDLVDLSVGQPDFDVPSAVKAAAIGAIEGGFNRYTSTGGIPELRDRIARRVIERHSQWTHYNRDGRDGFDVFVTAGVTGGLILAFMSLVESGNEVLMCDPYFGLYQEAVIMCGGTPVFVDTFPSFQITADLIASHLTERTKILLLNSPSNPTGAVIDREELRKIVTLAESRGVLVISDEIYSDFFYDNAANYPSVADFSTQALVFRGFSKSHSMTGWRIGYVYGPASLIRCMEIVQGQAYVCPATSAQAGAMVALDVPVDEHVQNYWRRKDLVISILSKYFEFSPPRGGFYAFVKVPDHLAMDDLTFAHYAISRGVLVVPGRYFSRRQDHFRISFTCPEKRLEIGLKRLHSLARE